MRFMYKKLCGCGVANSHILYKARFLSCKLLRLGKALKSFFSNSISLKFLTLKKNRWVAFTLIKGLSASYFCTEVITKIPLCLALTCFEFNSFEYLAISGHLLSHLELQVSDTILQAYRFLLYLLSDLMFPKPFPIFPVRTPQRSMSFYRYFVFSLTGSHATSTLTEGDPCIS